MKKIITLLLCTALFLGACTQTVKRDKDGNFISVKDTTTTAKLTKWIYTDSKGYKYPVWVSKNGKFFVIRTSKKGIKYNQYLKL